MGRGSVQVNNLNLAQGEFPAIERKLLFVGVGSNADNIGKVLSLDDSSDFDALLGDASSPLKTNLTAARNNAGGNWFAWVLPLSSTVPITSYDDEILRVMSSYFTATSPEAVVIVTQSHNAGQFNAWQTLTQTVLSRFARQIFVIAAAPRINAETQTWSDYESAMQTLVADVAANRVTVVPLLHGNDVGVLAGRLCRRDVGIADSPMRVKTGALVGLGNPAKDKDGVELPEATLAVLSAARYSTVQHYTDFAGDYWADATTLAAAGDDYSVLEYLRPVLKACRDVRLLAINSIADRNFNDTAESIAYYKTYFARPLRDMSKSTSITIGNQRLTLVADIRPPDKNSVVINWLSNTSVNVVLVVKPYNCPKTITANVVLDLTV